MMMMYAAPKFYHGSQVVYNSSKILMKQEPVDLMDRNRPVDMRISVRDSRAGTNLYIPMSPELMSCKSDKFYGCHTAAYHQESKTQSSSSIHVLGSSAEHHIVSSSTPPLEKDCYQTKSCDGKLLVPSVLTKNGRTPGFSSLDLLPVATHHRAKREFVPDCKKDDSYWCKRLKNNDSARRSRVKRKALEKMMESRLLELQKENIELKHEVAALRRRFGEEEGSNSDSSSSSSSSSRDQASSSMSDNTKAEDDQQNSGSDDSCSNDDSRVYGIGRASATNRDLMLTSRDRINSTESLSSSPSSSVISGSPRPRSRNSQGGSVDAGLRTDVTGALDLTSDCGSRSALAWESSSTDSFTSARTTSKRRSSCLSSDGGGSSSSQEDSSIRSLKVFPLKCRWKKEMYGSHMPVTEP